MPNDKNNKETNDEKVVNKKNIEIKKNIPKIKKESPEIKKLKKELKAANEQILNLSKKISELEIENKKNINDFQQKAKGFAKKAQEEVSRLRMEINAKQEEDLKHHKKYGSQKLLESILEPIINIELAVKAGKNNEAVKPYVIGFEMLLTQLENELATFGVFKINPKINEKYNPESMHAVSKIGKGDKVKELKKPGFKLHNRTIKPAAVIVG